MIQARARYTREQLLDAAADLFASVGYHTTTVQAVSARAGATKGALYGHFSSKQALASVLVQDAERAWAQLELGYLERTQDPVDQLEQLLRELAELVEQNPRVRAALRLVAEQVRSEPRPPDLLDRVHSRLADLVDRGQACGRIDPRHHGRTVAWLLVAALLGMPQLPLIDSTGEHPVQTRDLWSMLHDLLTAGAGAGAGAAAGTGTAADAGTGTAGAADAGTGTAAGTGAGTAAGTGAGTGAGTAAGVSAGVDAHPHPHPHAHPHPGGDLSAHVGVEVPADVASITGAAAAVTAEACTATAER
ncbi:TetR family transcriptional regulator [Streptacidiphilus sp. N1-3]|uniref:TetR family transcriptional regulator n=1 Tax=Streptacidiphilus alkalitolerans TaxID=3342712 RepID=A0ABV6WYH1_9ACTN